MPTRRRRCQPRTRKAFLNYPQLRFVRPSTAATSVNNLKTIDITTLSMAIHTDNQRYVGLFRKAAHTKWIPSWSGSFGSNRIQACGAIFLPHRQAPLGSSVEQYPIVTGSRRAHGRQGQASGGAERAPSLTAVARDGDRHLWSGRKNAPARGRTQEWGIEKAKKGRKGAAPSVDKKSPIQAVCGNPARTDLCRGRSAMSVPTANCSNRGREHPIVRVHRRERRRPAGAAEGQPLLNLHCFALATRTSVG
jgi:hypothetical protein